MNSLVVVIIPALNEEGAIGGVVARLLGTGLVARVIVVDNGSSDHTADAARAAGAEVVSAPKRGYDAACLAGVNQLQIANCKLQIESHKSEVIVFMDGDGSDDIGDLAALLAPIEWGEADLVIGSRTRSADRGSLTIPQRFGNALATGLIRMGWGVVYTDLGPFRAINRASLERLGLEDQGYTWTIQMQIRAVEEGLRVKEIPVRYHPRIGQSKMSGTLLGVWRAGTGILGCIARYFPIPGYLLSVALLMEAVYFTFYYFVQDQLAIVPYLGVMGGLFFLFGLAMWKVRGIADCRLQIADLKKPFPGLMGFILGMGLIFRMTLFPVGPLTSTDVYRYVWDGKVQAHGMNPYAYPPSHDALSSLKESEIHSRINHPDFPTIYPPVAQWGFRAAYGLGGDSLWGFKLLSLAAEFITCGLLIGLLIALGRSPLWVLGYAWCPLPIVEFFANGHVDVLGIPLLIGAVWLWVRGWWGGAAVAWTTAALVKMVPLVVLPAVWFRLGRRDRFWFLLVVVGLGIGFTAWFVPEINNGFATLLVYLNVWRFNGFAYTLLATIGLGEAARPICLYLLLFSVFVIGRRIEDVPRAITWCLMAFALLAPTVFPWYLTWMVPFLVMTPLWSGWTLIGFTQLSYVTLLEKYRFGDWTERSDVFWWQYAPVVGLLLWDIFSQVRKRNEKESVLMGG